MNKFEILNNTIREECKKLLSQKIFDLCYEYGDCDDSYTLKGFWLVCKDDRCFNDDKYNNILKSLWDTINNSITEEEEAVSYHGPGMVHFDSLRRLKGGVQI